MEENGDDQEKNNKIIVENYTFKLHYNFPNHHYFPAFVYNKFSCKWKWHCAEIYKNTNSYFPTVWQRTNWIFRDNLQSQHLFNKLLLISFLSDLRVSEEKQINFHKR